MRYTLKLLWMYKGWMYESRGSGSRVSLATKAWAVLVKGKKLFGSQMTRLTYLNLYSFQKMEFAFAVQLPKFTSTPASSQR